MTERISVVIPSSKADAKAAERLSMTLPWAYEVIVDTTPGGCAVGKNHGAAQAEGEIVLFLDADIVEVRGDPRRAVGGDKFDYWVPQRWEASSGINGDRYTRLTMACLNTFSSRLLWVQGACMAVRREPFLARGGFNDDAVWEDFNLARKLLWKSFWHGESGQLMPVAVVVGRRFTLPMRYLFPGNHSSSFGKSSSLGEVTT